MQAWRLEMAILWDCDYWERVAFRIQTRAIKRRTLEKMGKDIVYADPRYDDMLGCYLYNYWRVWTKEEADD